MADNDFMAPIMPTGSGLADLEVAREQDAVAGEQVVAPEQAPVNDVAGGPQTAGEAESEAHPS